MFEFLGDIFESILVMFGQESQNESTKEINEIIQEMEKAKLSSQEKLKKQELGLMGEELELKEKALKSQEKMNIMEMIEKRKEREFGEKTTKIGLAGSYLEENVGLRDKLMNFWGRMMPQRRAA